MILGAIVVVFSQRFIITGADLYVYHYMETNPGKFPSEVVDNIRNYLIKSGHLKEEVEHRICEMQKEETESKNAKECI